MKMVNNMDNIILINKEKEMTSHDLVNIVRRSLRMKRVGHTGTLDPNATGLMVIAVNKATKLVNYLQHDDKEYIFEMVCGEMSDTLDIWGEITAKEEVNPFTEEDLVNVLNSFLGKSEQIPPMYSAIKVDGRKLYELARNNETIELEPRPIEIYEIELIQFSPTIKVRVVSSSGTYIRSLIRDIGIKLDNLAIMSSLVRTRVGEYHLDDANSVDDIRERNIKFIDPETALSKYHKIEYNDSSDIFNGRRIKLDTDEDLVLITISNKSLAFYEREDKDTFKCKRGLW